MADTAPEYLPYNPQELAALRELAKAAPKGSFTHEGNRLLDAEGWQIALFTSKKWRYDAVFAVLAGPDRILDLLDLVETANNACNDGWRILADWAAKAGEAQIKAQWIHEQVIKETDRYRKTPIFYSDMPDPEEEPEAEAAAKAPAMDPEAELAALPDFPRSWTPARLGALRLAAEYASKGPRIFSGDKILDGKGREICWLCAEQAEAAGKYLAAASPDYILELLDHYQSLSDTRKYQENNLAMHQHTIRVQGEAFMCSAWMLEDLEIIKTGQVFRTREMWLKWAEEEIARDGKRS